MVVIGLSAVIGVSLFSSFIMGLNVWKRTASPDFNHRKLIIGMEKMSKDLRQIRDYPSVGFNADAANMTFVNVDDEKIYNVSYVYSSGDNCLHRLRAQMQAANISGVPKDEKIACGIESASFGYAMYNNATKTFDFMDIWNYSATGIPAAVKTEVTLKNGKTYKKYISIPIAQ